VEWALFMVTTSGTTSGVPDEAGVIGGRHQPAGRFDQKGRVIDIAKAALITRSDPSARAMQWLGMRSCA
jgi:hypothetical protein